MHSCSTLPQNSFSSALGLCSCVSAAADVAPRPSAPAQQDRAEGKLSLHATRPSMHTCCVKPQKCFGPALPTWLCLLAGSVLAHQLASDTVWHSCWPPAGKHLSIQQTL